MILTCESPNRITHAPLASTPCRAFLRGTFAGRGMRILNTAKMKKHGLCKTPEHMAWCSMKDRCYNQNTEQYRHYGGRGIKVCERWENFFLNFLEDMGERPSIGHSLDRFPNKSGDYAPDNCRWATQLEQQNNRVDNVIITYKGISKTYSEWGRFVGINKTVLRERICCSGWSIEKSLTHPVRTKGVSKSEIAAHPNQILLLNLLERK